MNWWTGRPTAKKNAARKLYNRQASIMINARALGVLNVLITAVLVIAAALVIYFLWPLIVAPS